MRSKEFERIFKSMNLQNVRIDKAGNVIGVRPGKSAHPNLVLAGRISIQSSRKEQTSRLNAKATLLKAPWASATIRRGLMTMLGRNTSA